MQSRENSTSEQLQTKLTQPPKKIIDIDGLRFEDSIDPAAWAEMTDDEKEQWLVILDM